MKQVSKAIPKTVNEYIGAFPKEVQPLLNQVRQTIKKAAPNAEELISYAMPAYKLNGVLVYFAGYKNHIGFYATPTGHEAFKKELSKYKEGKGSVQFPIDQQLPLSLITRIVKFRVKENEVKGTKKKQEAKLIKTKVAKLSDEEQVTEWIKQRSAAVQEKINTIRKIIMASSSKIKERIKWNAPSYYYKDDIVTFGPYKTHKLLLVFHHPQVVNIQSKLLEGTYKDRRLVYFKTETDAEANKKELSRIIKKIIETIDGKNSPV